LTACFLALDNLKFEHKVKKQNLKEKETNRINVWLIKKIELTFEVCTISEKKPKKSFITLHQQVL
jgi:hypothetical protein